MSAKISIIIPAYNEEKNIISTLQCVCSQTLNDIEIICVDDKSTDSTFELIKNYSEKDSRVIPLINKEKGVSSARNYGIEMASGEYICFIDADDSIHPQMMEFLLKAIEKAGSNIALCNFTRNAISEDLFEFDYKMMSPDEILYHAEMLYSSVWTKIVKKNFLNDNKIRFQGYKIGEDTIFSSELYKCNDFKAVPFVDFPLYLYERNTSSTLANMNNDRRIDMVQSRIRTYEILIKGFRKAAIYYLQQAMIYIAKYNRNNYFKDCKQQRKMINKIFRKHILTYLKSSEISLSDKLCVLISFYFKNLSKKIYPNL